MSINVFWKHPPTSLVRRTISRVSRFNTFQARFLEKAHDMPRKNTVNLLDLQEMSNLKKIKTLNNGYFERNMSPIHISTKCQKLSNPLVPISPTLRDLRGCYLDTQHQGLSSEHRVLGWLDSQRQMFGG